MVRTHTIYLEVQMTLSDTFFGQSSFLKYLESASRLKDGFVCSEHKFDLECEESLFET